MFERYTERARRVIFFARYEASHFGSPYIELEHLLLALFREDKALTFLLFQDDPATDIRAQIEARTVKREKVSTSVDLPLNNECKRALAYAAEEAERLGDHHIRSDHLLLGLLREKGSFAAQLLQNRGITLEKARSLIDIANQTGNVGEAAAGAEERETAEGRVIVSRLIEFFDETTQAKLGETVAMDVPRAGEEILIGSGVHTVTRVQYQYVGGTKPERLVPEKIVIHLRRKSA